MREQTIRDPFRHMEWADAVLWNIILASENDLSSNEGLLRRLRHIHGTEKAFLSVWRGEDVDFRTGPPREARSLMEFAQTLCGDIRSFVGGIDESRLDDVTELPWAGHFGEANQFQPAPTTLADTLYQLCAHGVHHRAQINSVLRELGHTPPLIDYIGWAWRGRPEAVWPPAGP